MVYTVYPAICACGAAVLTSGQHERVQVGARNHVTVLAKIAQRQPLFGSGLDDALTISDRTNTLISFDRAYTALNFCSHPSVFSSVRFREADEDVHGDDKAYTRYVLFLAFHITLALVPPSNFAPYAYAKLRKVQAYSTLVAFIEV
jgi:hypothetical protein